MVMKVNIRLIYLYLFSLVGLVVVVIGSVRMVNLALKTWVFKEADKYDIYTAPMKAAPENEPAIPSAAEQRAMQERQTARQRQRELSESLAMLAVGIPLYIYHWKLVQKEKV
jgi:hypothetical protein